MGRVLCLLVLAGACGVAAFGLSRQPTLELPGAQAWAARHHDPRALEPAAERALAAQLDGERRTDLVLLLAALAGGCLVVAAWPRSARFAHGAPTAVLLCASIGLGLFQLGSSAAGQLSGWSDGSLSVSDDTLDRLAPAHAATLRSWREQIAPDEAVILIGSDPWLYDLVVWALAPRPLYPMLLEIRPSTSTEAVLRGARALRVGPQHAVLWIVDLEVLQQGHATGHPALIRVER